MNIIQRSGYLMITQLINGLLNFLNSLFSLVILLFFCKFALMYFFHVRLRFPRFRNIRIGKVRPRTSESHNKIDYELKKFKYETKIKYKYQYKLEKFKVQQATKENHKRSSKLASLPDYLKVIK